MTPSVRQAHPQPWRQAHEEEVYAPRHELLLFPILVLLVIVALALGYPPA